MRLLRPLLTLLGLVFLVGIVAVGVGIFWIQHYIHSDEFRQEVAARAGRLLQTPVTIQRVAWDPLHGLKLDGVSFQRPPGLTSVSIAQVDCAYSWRDLLSRHLKITRLTLSDAAIGANPSAFAALMAAPLTAPNSSPASRPDPNPPTPAASTNSTAANDPTSFQFFLDAIEIRHGTIDLRDTKGVAWASFTGVNAAADTRSNQTGQAVTGKVEIGALQLSPHGVAAQFSTPFTLQPNGALQVRPMQADAYGGRLAGEFILPIGAPSTLEANARGLNLEALLTDFRPELAPHLDGTLELQSKWPGLETGQLQGEGDLHLTNGHLHNISVLQEIASALRLKELQAPAVREARSHFQVTPAGTRFSAFTLASDLFQLTGDGTISPRGDLAANLVLTLSSDAMRRLSRTVAASFVAQPDGTGTIAFVVTGTLDHPQTDLATRLILQNGQLQNFLNKQLSRFFDSH